MAECEPILATAEIDAAGALPGARGPLAFLLRASGELLGSLNPVRCMEITAQLAAEYLADAAVVVGVPSAGELTVVRCNGKRAAETVRLAVDPSTMPGLREALRGFPPVPSRWIAPDRVPSWVPPAGIANLGAVTVIPLPGHGVPAGALVLLRETGRGAFGVQDEACARLFAARAGAAVAAARMYTDQAQITETLMHGLLPPALPPVPGVEFATVYHPADDVDRVGGDFYNLYPDACGDGESLLVFGDVCGKGLHAAVLAGRIRTALNALAPLSADHQRVIDLLNTAVLHDERDRFATIVLASVTATPTGARLRVSSAGHPPPLVIRSGGQVEPVPTHGRAVGALPEAPVCTAPVDLAFGDTCLIYSDGITEARGGPLGGALFGEARLTAAAAECAGIPGQAMVERVHMLAAEWTRGGPRDDITAIAITPVPQAGGTGRAGH